MFDNLSYQLTPYDNFKDNLIVYPRCSKTLIFLYIYILILISSIYLWLHLLLHCRILCLICFKLVRLIFFSCCCFFDCLHYYLFITVFVKTNWHHYLGKLVWVKCSSCTHIFYQVIPTNPKVCTYFMVVKVFHIKVEQVSE